jgi:hypothetical protein
MRRLTLAFLGLVAFTGAAFAQATSVQQAPSRLDAATGVAFAQAAKGSISTATVTVPAGLYAYVTGVSIDVCADGTGGNAYANLNFTTTNLQSTPSFAVSAALAANTCAVPIREWYATPLKSSQAGVNVTVVGPAVGATNQQTIRVYFYLAP